ncbi:C40 family peptidase [Actinacidiphila acidipaludis]|uniref:C40 family peptidase n=1 Tax=Actinacidiphila acidipaludis TaxID=2873382 RepID=A0ABS7Q5Z0_9ACTN|nr:C40 family peptidase [Streptomyces acidipaludis]MBY8878149.1 C40 family peptidase [Streptomyces acidipaludis]
MSDSHTHTGRRRHAAPRDAKWTRRAGLVGGVVSALALGGAAAPAMADNTHHSAPVGAHAPQAVVPAAATTTLSTVATARQAAAALQQDAIDVSLAAAKQQAATDAKKAAAEKKAADAAAAKKKAAAQAAKERAAAQAAASRSEQRAPLSVTTLAATTTSSVTTAAPASSGKAGQLIAFLKSQIGKPYVYGATGPGSYDCSGLTQAAFGSVGVTLPRTSQEQSTVGTPVSISALQPGDLIFWGGEGSAYHVGVFIGNGQYLDAANPSTPVGIHQLADYMPDWAVRVL